MSVSRLAFAAVATAAVLLSSAAHARPPIDFSSRADGLLRRHLSAGDFSGTVLVCAHGRLMLRQGYGLANRELGAPATPQTVFRIGSTTKTFTAAAILQLVEAGALRLDSPIQVFVEGLPAAWSAVTIRQLLDHSSGIPDYVQVNGFLRGPARMDLTPMQLVALVHDKPLEFHPGSEFKYSNTGYALLGLIIERVSGEPYADYIRDHLIRPLGLTHTAYDNLQEVVPERASGYALVEGKVKNAWPVTPSAAYAAGGVRSTGDDLLRWSQALQAGKVLKASSLKAMFTDEGHGYGLGSFVEMRHGHRLWDHGGNLPGFASAFEFYPDDDLFVIVLTNLDGDGAEHIAKELAGAYFGWTDTPLAPRVK